MRHTTRTGLPGVSSLHELVDGRSFAGEMHRDRLCRPLSRWLTRRLFELIGKTMSGKPHREKQRAPATPERTPGNAALTQQVLETLGSPVDLYRVHVQQLWPEHYRVNVFIGVDAASARIVHSYFLVADAAGNILASTPPITRHYEPAAVAAADLALPS